MMTTKSGDPTKKELAIANAQEMCKLDNKLYRMTAECDALKAEVKMLRGQSEPVLYMAKNMHNNSYATSSKEAEAKLYLAQSGLKNDGIEATIIPLFTHPPAQNSNIVDLVSKAKAVVERWETTSWKDTEPTGTFIYALRDAVENYKVVFGQKGK